MSTDSIIWEAFDIDKLDASKSICRFCNANMSHGACDPHGHNTDLRGHLRSMHSDHFERLQKRHPEWILPAHSKKPGKPSKNIACVVVVRSAFIGPALRLPCSVPMWRSEIYRSLFFLQARWFGKHLILMQLMPQSASADFAKRK